MKAIALLSDTIILYNVIFIKVNRCDVIVDVLLEFVDEEVPFVFCSNNITLKEYLELNYSKCCHLHKGVNCYNLLKGVMMKISSWKLIKP